MSGREDTRAEHDSNVGFTRFTADENPWTQELFGEGVNAAYCMAASTRVPFHNGIRWWAESQFGEEGIAYCPFGEQVARLHGVFEEDHASLGQPANLELDDIVLLDWGGDGVTDHAETVKAVYADGTFDTWGYNIGNPQGCHVVHRDRRFLKGVIHTGALYNAVAGGGAAPSEHPVITRPFPLPFGHWYGEPNVDPRAHSGEDDVSDRDPIREIQSFLNWNRDANLELDGGFGTLTGDAVELFQRDVTAFGFDTGGVDRECGRKTWEVMMFISQVQ